MRESKAEGAASDSVGSLVHLAGGWFLTLIL